VETVLAADEGQQLFLALQVDGALLRLPHYGTFVGPPLSARAGLLEAVEIELWFLRAFLLHLQLFFRLQQF
jgi:hypothetical protein